MRTKLQGLVDLARASRDAADALLHFTDELKHLADENIDPEDRSKVFLAIKLCEHTREFCDGFHAGLETEFKEAAELARRALAPAPQKFKGGRW